MSNQEYWRGCSHRQVYHPANVWYTVDSSRVEYGQEGYGRHGHTFQNDVFQAADDESYRANAGHDYDNYWCNEIFYGNSNCHHCRRDCVSSYGSSSSTFQDVTGAESYSNSAGSNYVNNYDNEACHGTSSCHHLNDYGSSSYGCSSSRFDITDEQKLDGEVRRRMHQMDCIPHFPKINNRIPSADEASSDHQRLLERLELYDLYELKVSGDGNCQFRSISDQLYRTANNHDQVRQQVVDQLKAHPELYAPYVPMPYHEYLITMSRLGEWGDHVTLQAAADLYGVRIFVLTSFKDTCYIEIIPRQQKSEKVLFLSFWSEVHYNSIYPRGDSYSHMRDTDIKKKWWSWKK